MAKYNPHRTVVCSFCNEEKKRWKTVSQFGDFAIPNVVKHPTGLYACEECQEKIEEEQ